MGLDLAYSIVVIGCLDYIKHHARCTSDPTHTLGHGKTSTSVYPEIRRTREPLSIILVLNTVYVISSYYEKDM